jgi:hypothetical protein
MEGCVSVDSVDSGDNVISTEPAVSIFRVKMMLETGDFS